MFDKDGEYTEAYFEYLTKQLRSGADFDYESGGYFSTDGIMEDAADLIDWLCTKLKEANEPNLKP